MVPHFRENNPHGLHLDALNSFTKVDVEAMVPDLAAILMQDRSDKGYENDVISLGRRPTRDKTLIL